MSAEVSDTVFSQVMMMAIQPKTFYYKLPIPSWTVFRKINISSLRMCFRAGALSGWEVCFKFRVWQAWWQTHLCAIDEGRQNKRCPDKEHKEHKEDKEHPLGEVKMQNFTLIL